MSNMKNETKTGPPPTSDADPSPERIVEGRSGLARLTEAMKQLLRVSKAESLKVSKEGDQGIKRGVS